MAWIGVDVVDDFKSIRCDNKAVSVHVAIRGTEGAVGWDRARAVGVDVVNYPQSVARRDETVGGDRDGTGDVETAARARFGGVEEAVGLGDGDVERPRRAGVVAVGVVEQDEGDLGHSVDVGSGGEGEGAGFIDGGADREEAWARVCLDNEVKFLCNFVGRPGRCRRGPVSESLCSLQKSALRIPN